MFYLFTPLIVVDHPIWYYNAFFYLFVILAIVTSILVSVFYKKMASKSAEIKLIQQQHIARIDSIRKDHGAAIEKLRLDMLKREEERTRQWIESEKENLHVLNGVTKLLEISNKFTKSDSDKIFKKLEEILQKIKNE